MPGWEVHLTVASMTVLVVATGCALGFYQGGLSLTQMRSAFPFISALILGSAALLVGSVLPDLDGKGRIRWTIGPVIGAFALIPPFYGNLDTGGFNEAMEFIWNDGARLFLIVTLSGYLLLLLPMKHRGRMHTNTPGFVFGTALAGYVHLSSSLGLEGSVLVGILGTLGYLWHLSLDGELSFSF